MSNGAWSPSRAVLQQRVAELAQHAPFAQMATAHVEAFVRAGRETYHAPGDLVLDASHGPVQALHFVRRGIVRGERRDDAAAGGAATSSFQYEAGELFPIGAMLGARAVTTRYTAQEDLFCLEVEAAVVHELMHQSPPFAAFLQHRVAQLLALSTQALGAVLSQHALAEQSMEAPLASLPRRAPVACAPHTPLVNALREMHERRVGSIVALDEAGSVLGILTRHDVLERVALAHAADELPVLEVMSHPVLTLDESATVHDAALLMSRHGVRHVPITAGGAMVSIVSERDLFTLQKRSLKQVSSTIRAARSRPALIEAAAGIRRFANHLMQQGLAARSLTGLISHLNDLVVERAVALVAVEQGADLRRCCWLAFGSEGRAEQTIATDQDNGLIFVAEDAEDAERQRPAWLRFGEAVNELLDACGYPLCRGNIMARNPECCRSQQEWLARFDQWLDRGEPEDLLAASIYFDLRALSGAKTLAEPLLQHIVARAPGSTRFLLLMAQNALRFGPALDWMGALDTESDGAHRWLDLKMRGTAPIVDAARLFALAHGVAETGTRERLQAIAPHLRVPAEEAQGWVSAFEALQVLRLRRQIEPEAGDAPNRIDVAVLDSIDRRVLKEAMQVVRRLQQRLQMDFRS